jgi:hypothetical protein
MRPCPQCARRIVLLSGPEDDFWEEPSMRFRLTYEGELRPTQRDALDKERNKLALHKHAIRRVFHRQIKRLWETNRFLSDYRTSPSDYNVTQPTHPIAQRSIAEERPAFFRSETKHFIPLRDAIAAHPDNHAYGYRFVPLVRNGVALLCSLDILFLRRDIPGSIIQNGDIDNRIKTLIDALRRPNSQNEMPAGTEPQEGDDPFFCLLNNDKDVSHFAVETDTLLDPMKDEEADQRRVKLIITVELRPYHVTSFTLAFA